MDIPKFSTNSLVTYQDGIYQVLSMSAKGPSYHYKIILVAHQRDMKRDEFHSTITLKEMDVEESLLSDFKSKAPRYKHGDGVRLRGETNCIVQFIEYRNYNYFYTVREKVHWDDKLQNGWIVEESYLQKW